jgi:hypothetical protein
VLAAGSDGFTDMNPWLPRHIRLVALDLVAPLRQGFPHDDETYLAATLDWLCAAQDVLEERAKRRPRH